MGKGSWIPVKKVRKGRKRYKPYPKGCGPISCYDGLGRLTGVLTVHSLHFCKKEERISKIKAALTPGAPIAMAEAGKSMGNGINSRILNTRLHR